MKLIVTKEMGRLARWLRILGLDTVYFKSDNLATLIVETLREDRIVITRRKKKIGVLEKKTVVIEATQLKEQIRELIKKLNLKIREEDMFTRCTLCNCLLKEIEKEKIKEKVPAYVYQTKGFFMQCPGCSKVYWQGSHWGNVRKVIARLTSPLQP